MKCPFCGGSGVNKTWVATDTVSEYKQTCFKCHGTGEWDCTNGEFIRHCSDEELAELLFNAMFNKEFQKKSKIMRIWICVLSKMKFTVG